MKRTAVTALLLLAAGALPAAAATEAVAELKPNPPHACFGRAAFHHVLGGLHIEGAAYHLPDQPSQLVLLPEKSGENSDMNQANPLPLADFYKDETGIGTCEKISPSLVLKKILGRELAIMSEGKILARGLISTPRSE